MGGRGGLGDRRHPVRWEVADDEAFRRRVASGRVRAVPELGHGVHVEVEGLQPGREYHFRFISGDEVSPTGRTRTAPAGAAAGVRLGTSQPDGEASNEPGRFAELRAAAFQAFHEHLPRCPRTPTCASSTATGAAGCAAPSRRRRGGRTSGSWRRPTTRRARRRR